MNEQVLIADDEKEIADLLDVYLRNEGFRTRKFYNGNDAIECIRNEHIDIALLDIMMPDIDGLQLEYLSS